MTVNNSKLITPITPIILLPVPKCFQKGPSLATVRACISAQAWTVTESQNHRVVGVGRDHCCGSSSPTLLLKQGHLQQAAQDLVQAGLEYLQRRRLSLGRATKLGHGR